MRVESKRISRLLFVMLFVVLTGVTAQAENKVLNIYFAGTGNTVNGSNYIDGVLGITLQKFDPELISALYANDESSSNLSSGGKYYKKFVDGIGSTLLTLLNQADPALPGRGWVECLNEAKGAFTSVVNATGDDDQIILNLIGFSRGGVLTMIMARWASDYDSQSKIEKINILAYDPVPGYPLGDPLFWLEFNPFLPNNALTLSNRVDQFVSIYARDEKSLRFEPVIPKWDSSKTDTLLLMLPGSHETLVGNTEINGHAGVPVPLIPSATEPELVHVSRMSRLIAEHLMSGPNWGGVSFAEPLYAEDAIEAGFLSEIASIYTNYLHSLYKDMNSTSFLPHFPVILPFQGIDKNYLTLNRDHQLLVPIFFPEFPFVFLARWCYISPHRHAFEIVWRFPIPWVFASPDQVYNLYDEVDWIDRADDWSKINNFRGESTEEDTEAPVPNVAILPDITGESSAEITNPPKATDNVDGTVVGETGDPISYTEQGTYTVHWTYTDQAGNIATQDQTVIVQELVNVNDYVNLEPNPSTYSFSRDTTGCLAGFVGKFSFYARLTNTSSSPLYNLMCECTTLTHGNLMHNADGGPAGVGARMTIPKTDNYSDGKLSPGESVDVRFEICLKKRKWFRFYVNVLGMPSS